MKKRGFTLIELLAVIIILAIIALIATPIVMGVINRSKKGASKASVQNYLHAIETQAVAYRMDGEVVSNGTYWLNSDGDVCISSDCTKKLEIKMTGPNPSSGVITIEEGKVVSVLDLYINPKYYRYIDGEIEEFEVGGYTDNNEYISWDTLIKEGYITLSNDKKTITGHNDEFAINITKLVIPPGIITIGSYAFSGCTGLTSIIIPEGVTYIDHQAFNGCSNLSSIRIPNSVNNISSYAFRGCASLKSIVIPKGVTSVKDYIFYGCTNLTSITIPESVTSIGTAAFWGCNSLEEVNLPNSLMSIGWGAFHSGLKLRSIIIPASVVHIDAYAFNKLIETVEFEDPHGWKAGDNLISSSVLSNSTTAAEYLKSNLSVIWEKS